MIDSNEDFDIYVFVGSLGIHLLYISMQKYKEVVEILAIERICKHSARDERLPAKVDLDVRKNAKT